MEEVREVELKGLRALRRSRGMRQEDLAEAIGSDQYSVSQWERGVRSPRPTTIKRLADALGVEPQDLFAERPLAAPLAEPAPVEDVAALLRSRCGNDLLIVDEEELEARASERGLSGIEEMMRDLAACNRAAWELMHPEHPEEGEGISREMRAALREARKGYQRRLVALRNWGIRELHAEAERIATEHEGANVVPR